MNHKIVLRLHVCFISWTTAFTQLSCSDRKQPGAWSVEPSTTYRRWTSFGVLQPHSLLHRLFISRLETDSFFFFCLGSLVLKYADSSNQRYFSFFSFHYIFTIHFLLVSLYYFKLLCNMSNTCDRKKTFAIRALFFFLQCSSFFLRTFVSSLLNKESIHRLWQYYSTQAIVLPR